MPKTIYTAEQVTITMALLQGGLNDQSVSKFSGVNKGTVKALRLGRVKIGAIGARHDVEVARRIALVLQRGKLQSLQVMAEVFRAAAATIETELTALNQPAQ